MAYNVVDIIEQEDAIEIKTAPVDFFKVKEELTKRGCKIFDAEIKLISQSPIEILTDDAKLRLEKFIASCDDDEDIQTVITNYEG
ncbi:hypothetical protein FACS1894218_6150 [Bacilli bacterium]|nr:hypothetical protein FACS1894218_6150 [Bacilli bacterium]